MKATEKISKTLNDYMARTDELRIEQWHFTFNEGQAISLGLDNNEIGGPYTPPSTHDIYKGSVYIRWADGRVSDSIIDTFTLENLDASIKEWKTTSYQDIDAHEVIQPLPMPTGLKIKDDNVVNLITKDSSYFFEILNYFNENLKKKDYTKTVKGQVSAGMLCSIIMNSKGLNVGWEGTSMSVYASVNDICGDNYAERNMPEKKDLNKILKEIDRYMMHTKNVTQIKSGKMQVILTPGTLGQFLEKYVLEEMDGETVTNQSVHSLEDFKAKKQVFNEKINIVIDGLSDYSLSTQPCSGEGVPSTKSYLIANGRLITPILDLKYAKKSGMPPTPPGEIDLDVAMAPYSKMIKGLGYGLIVYDVLGMHTQDSKSGEYSLAVDQGLLVENGKIQGKIKSATIKGNFFETLKDKKTKFAEYRKDEIAMLTESNVTAN